ncbi:MAG: glycosyltransferase family 4 protein [Thermomicrobiales bacterium]
MRALFVITRGDEIGGAQSYVRDLMVRMASDGHDAHLAVGSSGALTAVLDQHQIPWSIIPGLNRDIDPRHDIGAVRKLVDLIRKLSPDLLSAHSSKAGIVARLAARKAGVPCIFTAHGWAFTEGISRQKQLLFRGIERAMAPLAARIICVSEYDHNLAQRYGFPTNRLVTIHNGILDRPHSPRIDQPGPIRVAMTARFAPPKQPVTLLRAIAPLLGTECWLIGDGPNLEEARTAARQLGIEDRVRFWGKRDDVPALLEQCHVFVLSSDWEGFPIATLEAMRAALPVIVSDVGGATEAIAEGISGYAVPKRDYDAMRDRIRRLAGDAGFRHQMGDAARARYLERFTFDEMYRRTIGTYEAAMLVRRR